MFERFTESAREIVRDAVKRADDSGAAAVSEETLFLALLDRTGTPAARALEALCVGEYRVSVAHAVDEARRRGGLSRSDADALAGFGIDVDHIVSRVEEAHGEGALTAARSRRRKRRLTPGAQQILEKALRIAVGRGDRSIGDEHLLLAFLVLPGVAADVLADHGVSYEGVENVLAARAA